MSRFLLSPDLDEPAVAAALEPAGEAVFGPPEILTVSFLDTFDWRLHSAGLVLVEERGHGRRLCLVESGSDSLVVPTGRTPKVATDLPPGHLADRVGQVQGIRALLAVGATRVVRRDGRLQDGDGNLAARLRLEEIEVLDERGEGCAAPLTTLWIDVPSFGPVAGMVPTADHDLELAAAARGRVPGDYSSKLRLDLEPGMAAGRALRAILADLLATLEANVPGAIGDLDSEFLHDLRVAGRRTRSALTQIKGVLPEDLAAPFNDELRWLGIVTGPLRDLDVYLLELPNYRAMLPAHAAADLDPVEALIRRERTRARRTVVRALRSQRFSRLLAGWRNLLEADIPPGSVAAAPISDLASRRIARAYRRILKHGRNLDLAPPAAALHRLRIDAKKLRYLLEFFRSLYPDTEVAARVDELKSLQDILGGFNDIEAQRRRLADFAGMLHADRRTGAGCLLSLGRLAGALEQRQESFRSEFHQAFADFASDPVRLAYRRLFGGKEPS